MKLNAFTHYENISDEKVNIYKSGYKLCGVKMFSSKNKDKQTLTMTFTLTYFYVYSTSQ